MTKQLKLPEVGKNYRLKEEYYSEYPEQYVEKIKIIIPSNIAVTIFCNNGERIWALKDFWMLFEEMPVHENNKTQDENEITKLLKGIDDKLTKQIENATKDN